MILFTYFEWFMDHKKYQHIKNLSQRMTYCMLCFFLVVGCFHQSTETQKVYEEDKETTDTDTITATDSDDQISHGANEEDTPKIIVNNVIILGEGPFSDPENITNVWIEGKYIREIGQDIGNEQEDASQTEQRWLVPAFIDSHVHFAYLPKSEEMLRAGICAAVDLASPESFLTVDVAPMQMIYSGPMVTSELGYPTQSWGSDGYGIQCATEECVLSSIQRLHSNGVSIIKIPLVGAYLEEDLLRIAVAEAHHLGLKIVTHAMNEEVVQTAADMDMDVLAHCPTGQLSDETIQKWSSKTLIPTISAFGGSTTTIDNLRRFHESGTTILYGTDFGNANQIGISSTEISLMMTAGFSGTEIINAGTYLPATYWGFEELGQIREGYRASFLVYAENPIQNPVILSQPMEVWIDGQKQE